MSTLQAVALALSTGDSTTAWCSMLCCFTASSFAVRRIKALSSNAHDYAASYTDTNTAAAVSCRVLSALQPAAWWI
jgi:hypothetical protein